jgi:hypothetical protein
MASLQTVSRVASAMICVNRARRGVTGARCGAAHAGSRLLDHQGGFQRHGVRDVVGIGRGQALKRYVRETNRLRHAGAVTASSQLGGSVGTQSGGMSPDSPRLAPR